MGSGFYDGRARRSEPSSSPSRTGRAESGLRGLVQHITESVQLLGDNWIPKGVGRWGHHVLRHGRCYKGSLIPAGILVGWGLEVDGPRRPHPVEISSDLPKQRSPCTADKSAWHRAGGLILGRIRLWGWGRFSCNGEFEPESSPFALDTIPYHSTASKYHCRPFVSQLMGNLALTGSGKFTCKTRKLSRPDVLYVLCNSAARHISVRLTDWSVAVQC